MSAGMSPLRLSDRSGGSGFTAAFHTRAETFERCLPGLSDGSMQLCQPSSRSFSLGLDELGGRSLLGARAPPGELPTPTPLLPADAPLPGLGILLPEPGGVLVHRTPYP